MTTVITGAANGLGLALTQACQARGDTVLAVDHDAAALAELEGVKTLTLDLTAPNAASELLKAVPDKVTTIIHSAGISGTGRFEDIPAEHHQRIMALNFEAPVQITCALLASDACAPKAKHVFIGSLSTFTGYPGATSYAASKDGLASFARSLNKSLPRGSSAHCVFPGPMRTEHAAKYAPDNSAETVARRQSTDDAANLILRAVARGSRTILPGRSAKAFAVAASLVPGLVETALIKSLFAKMDGIRL